MLATRALFGGAATPDLSGSWTPDASRQPVTVDSLYTAFPGVCKLDGSRVLCAYRQATSHVAAQGDLVGRIGTLSGTAVSWGAEFTIHSDPGEDDIRCDDAVSLVDGQVVIAARLHDGDDNHDPFLLICDDDPNALTSSSTWTKHDIAFTTGADDNLVNGHVIKVGSTYLIGGCYRTLPGSGAAVLTSSSLTDWSSPTIIDLGTSGKLNETIVGVTPSGSIMALVRRLDSSNTYKSFSTDGGASFSTPVLAHSGYGLPMWRTMPGGVILTVYRDSPDGDTAWRVSNDIGASWGTEAILDTLGARSVYASLARIDLAHYLCVYGVENSTSDADLYSQVFTRA